MDHQAKQRKRSAVSSLRALAVELGLNTSRRRADLSKDDFTALHAEVAIQRTTPEQNLYLYLYIHSREESSFKDEGTTILPKPLFRVLARCL